MAGVKLSGNATVLDVVRTLDQPRGYVLGVFNNMHDYKRRHGSAFVRIGITGRGMMPNYRLEPTNDSVMGFLADLVQGGDVDRHFVAYHGRNHEQLDWGPKELKGPHWSSAYLDHETVRTLLLELPTGKRT
ncbi:MULTISPECIES: hypothetical protein [unclassified Mesorhizobium]|uniref:hypothetical protein n=1 Tax=unclassified Mesorhizobium TaxID=325217 RepID=UPI0012EBD6C4|nr:MULTISPECIES: hypothetical protein [unclassified Mesorhizobium]